jgi:hypothetical protein
MTAPSSSTLAASLKREVSDPLVVTAFAACLAWARVELGRLPADLLADLGEQNLEAVYGYARDVYRLPKSSFGYFDTDDGAVGSIGNDIGRRWRPMLHHGMVSRVAGFA